ncbi:outer membrane protein assembly factor BamB family protein [Humisphaera borealis]|uniref:PQQ-binding-like beta-propeller repeat protein n=1 Tax=Humisphaera borealis TaxID=2807512 RepID=A0A7M2WSA0_9BACT|nr:PQQ-binding-like beta-propeller repeat protein [Humisphaera borealis]QOV88052.1 PQQ-binding-like beta-propeller repeat protein [Humisphaera borealis]
MKRGLWTLGVAGLMAVGIGCSGGRKASAAPVADAGKTSEPRTVEPKSPEGKVPEAKASQVKASEPAPESRVAEAKAAEPAPTPAPVKPVTEAAGTAIAAADTKAPVAQPAAGTAANPNAKDAPKVVPAEKAAKGFDPATAPQGARIKGWYQWRGPEQNGISRETGLVDTWNPDTGENVIWTSPVGGMSSPVIWNNKIYTWSRSDEVAYGEGDTRTFSAGPKTREALVCIDATTGKELWRHLNNMTQTEVPFHRLGWSSPCVDPSTGNVYALGSQCWMICLNGETGKVIWQRQMTEEFGMISTFGGRTQSPAVDEDQVFITGVAFGFGDNARSAHRIFAFNKHTGALNWTGATGGIPVDAPQNTPVVTVVNGQRLVIFAAGDGGVHAFQARSGKKAWTFLVSKRGLNTSVVVDGTKLYCTHGLGNFDSNALGRVFCIDMAQLEKGSPKELWKVTGIEAAFPTPVVTEKYLYVMDDRAKLYQYDKETGKQLWKKNCGQVGKPSPVFADGKLYAADGDGKFWILKPGEKSAETLSKVDLSEKLGREYVIYGSPAIADGRVYLQAATKLYCIGKKDSKPEYGQIPPMAEESAKQDKVASLQVIPADVVLRAGESVKFTVRAFDANGRFLSEIAPDKATWAVGKLTIPATPPPRNMPRPDNAPAPAGSADYKEPEKPATAPATLVAAPTLAGNLTGEVTADGTFVAKPGPHQAGAIDVTVDGVKTQARVRVFPPLPWKFDFEAAPVDKPPLTWLGAGGKYSVVVDPDNANNKVLQKLMNIDLYYRARTNFGAVDMADYTVQADVKANEKIIAERRVVPDGAVINQRYVLVLNGMQQRLQIHIWPSALPDPRNPSGSKHSTIDFPWEAKKWYRLKLEVTQHADKAVARGKAWPVGTDEPKEWQVALDDDIPNRTGNPGLFTVSLVGDQKSEVYYDNILVTDNKAAAPAANAK